MNRLTIIIGLLLSLGVYAQEKVDSLRFVQAQAKGLKIGNSVPEVRLDKIVNPDGTISSGKLSDYADRLLILDFMYTSCSSCIGGLPHKDQLQKEFGDRIKIMTVVGGELYSPGMIDRENAAFIQKYLTKPDGFLASRGVQIPWVVENKTLNAYFPHILVSHLVWIYKGKVLGFTEQDYVDRHNIELILAGKDPELPIKNDFVPAVDETTPLIQQDSERFTGKRTLSYATVGSRPQVGSKTMYGPVRHTLAAESSSYYAMVKGAYQDGVYTSAGTVVDSVKKNRRDYIINLSILNVYTSRWMQALDTSFILVPSHIVFEVKDPSWYVQSDDQGEYNLISRNKTQICYESIRLDAGQSEKEIALTTIRDLDYLLGLHGRFEQRKMKCLVMKRSDNIDRLRSKGMPKSGDANLETPQVMIRNNPLNLIVWQLNQQYGNSPVFDETGYQGNVDLDLQLNSWKDITALRKQLKSYGIELREEERELQVFVLTEKEGVTR